MASRTIWALAGLITLASAQPHAQPPHHLHHPREFVWETVTHEVIQTVSVTTTIWLEPGETAPAQKQEPALDHSPANVQPAAYTPPASPVEPVEPAEPAEPVQSSQDAPSYAAPLPTTTSPVYVAPVPASTSVAPIPAASAPSHVAPPPASTPVTGGGGSSSGGSGLSSGMAAAGKVYTGDLTSYTPGLGACGTTDTTDQPVVAMNAPIFDSYNNGNSNNNPLCGKMVTITNASGETFQAKVVDRCPVCKEGDLDLAGDLFTKVTGLVDDRVPGVQWSFD